MKFLLAASFLAATVNAAGSGTFFSYYEEGGFGPSNWALLALEGNQCGGTNGASGFGQSPVTIVQDVSDNCDTDMSAYEFTAGDCTWDDLDFTISNNGVTAAPKKDSACSYGQMNIPHTPNKFNALQYHIHIFSEHQIIGQGTNGYFPAELHVVHQEETEESYAVFGTMMDIGTEDHPVFEYFLQGWEAKAESIQRACAESTQSRFLRAMAETVDFVPVQQKVQCPVIGTINSNATEPSFPEGESPDLYNLPDDKDFGTFTYKGGLTTPGCTEIVNWNLLDKAMTISESQMRRLEAVVMCYVAQVIDETDGSIKQCYYGTVADEAGSTSRPPQPLKGRKVTHRCRDGPAVKYVDVGELPLDEAVSAPQSEPAKEVTKEETKVKPGFIALFVIIGITVLMGAAFYLHKMQLDSQSNRYRELFAKRIAETIEFTGKNGQLTRESLEDAFRRMDIDGDGNVSKEEMRQFMGDKMSAKDFDVMFIAMDIDQRGTVEFAEFCSFMTHVFAACDKANSSGARSVPAAVPKPVSAPVEEATGVVENA